MITASKAMDLLRNLPSKEELTPLDVPKSLKLSFRDTIRKELEKVSFPAVDPENQENTIDRTNVKDLDAFFQSIGDTEPLTTAPVKKNVRRSLENLSLSNSKHNSMSLAVEEFPMALLQDNAQRINQLTSGVFDKIAEIRKIDSEKAEFQRLLDGLEESAGRLSETTDMLAQKGTLKPKYNENVDYLSLATKENLETMELLLRNLKARKQMETKLGEVLPDPNVTAESIHNIKVLVEQFINDDAKKQKL